MRIGLVGYFDVGKSYGLGDDIFPEEDRAPAPDISLVGINFPLGHGVVLNLRDDAPGVVELWREGAKRQVRRKGMEMGWSEGLGVSRDEFDRTLEALAEHHPIARCAVRIHAVGTVYTELHFENGVPLDYMDGMLRCFEYAAYTPGIADALEATAKGRIRLERGREGLVELSGRDLPVTMSDGNGYSERMLFNGFTRLIACVDEGDDAYLAELTEAMGLRDDDVIDFEYHGKLHYGWGACLLLPNQLERWDEPGGEGERPGEQILRMEACIRVAHVFLGTCEAFTRLFSGEIHKQVGGYVQNRDAGRSPEDLNRLRTLALAVVNLTDFDKVTPAEEDQVYFRKFNENADIRAKQETIQQATEILYNVQAAKTQTEATRREWFLSIVVGLLTSLTLISVTADAYDFIRADQSLIHRQSLRLLALTAELALIVAVLMILLTRLTRSRRSRALI